MRCLYEFIVAHLVLIASCTAVFGQLENQLKEAPVKVTRIDGKVLIGPDPNIVLDRYQQLRDPLVQQELGLSEKTTELYAENTRVFLTELATTRRKERSGELPRGSVNALLKQHSKNAEQFLDEFLTPGQAKRLVELMLRLEVHRLGLGEALTEGRLSIAAGVHNEQVERLVRRAAVIQAETDAAIQKLKQEAEKRLFDELAPEQRKNAIDALGEPFVYRNLTASQKLYYEISEQTKIEVQREVRN